VRKKYRKWLLESKKLRMILLLFFLLAFSTCAFFIVSENQWMYGRKQEEPHAGSSATFSLREEVDVGPVVSLAKEVVAKNPESPFILVMEVSIGMVDMVKSWLCNTRDMARVHSNTLLIVDTKSFEVLKDFDTEATIVESSLPDYLQGSWKYRSLGYWLTTQHRVLVVGKILSAGINLMLVEPDATWLKNIYNQDDLVADMRDDFVGMSDTEVSGEIGYLGFGFLRIKASPVVDRIWEHVKMKVEQELLPYKHDKNLTQVIQAHGEQLYFNEYWKRLHAAGEKIKVRKLSHCRYPNGRWYDGGIMDDDADYRAACPAKDLVVIQNNWIVGNEKKIERLKRWDHWFVDQETNLCLPDQLKKARRTCLNSKPLAPP